MINYRATLALIGISMFVVLGQWPGQAAAEVNIDIGGVLRDKFRWLGRDRLRVVQGTSE
jgi:hypothetical protein